MKASHDYQISPWPHLRNTVIHACSNARPRTIYAASEVDFTRAQERISELRRATRMAVSVHSFVLGCIAKAASQYPMLHAFRHGKKLVTFNSIDVGTIIDQHASDVLKTRLPVVYIVRDADRKSIAQINWEIRQAARTDLGKNPDVTYRRRLTKLPPLAQKIMFRRLLRDPWLHRRYFGTLGFTSAQSPGYVHPLQAFVPNLHGATVAMGNLHPRFLPDENGQPTLRRALDLVGAFDHDMVDGMLLSRFGLETSQLIENAYGLDNSFIEETRALVQNATNQKLP